MSDEAFGARIAQARERIDQLPEAQRAPLLNLLAETVRRHEEMRHHFARIHDAISDWQLMIKYLLFDREATVRERDELRRRLNEKL